MALNLPYIPPFWPTIDYTFDAVVGIMTISANSMVRNAASLTEELPATTRSLHR
jgi:hypothetical protein